MDSQFNTLSRSYHDNYVDYSVTGNQKYKVAYEAAKQGLDTIIAAKKTEAETNSENIKGALGSDAASLFHENQSALNSIGEGIHKQKDRVVEGQMRLPIDPPPTDHTTQYIVLGALLGAIVLLQII